MEVSYNGGIPKSSILFSDLPLQTIQELGIPHFKWKPPYVSIYFFARIGGFYLDPTCDFMDLKRGKYLASR
jgi:hypothetical protein